MALLFAGCSHVETVPYEVTSFPEVALKEKSEIKIMSFDKSLEGLVGILKEEFAKTGNFKVTDDKARYWFIINGLKDYSGGGSQDVVSVAKQEDANEVREILVSTKYNFASAAEGVSVSVYDAKKLVPVHYFEIPIYTGERTKGAVSAKDVYSKKFAKDVVERVMDVFVTQTKPGVATIPNHSYLVWTRDLILGLRANEKLCELFKQGKGSYFDFLVEYKKLGLIDLNKFCEEVRTGVYEGKDATERLGNYHLYLLVREALSNDPDTIADIKAKQMEILRTTDSGWLSESIPVALARLEYKLANIGK